METGRGAMVCKSGADLSSVGAGGLEAAGFAIGGGNGSGLGCAVGFNGASGGTEALLVATCGRGCGVGEPAFTGAVAGRCWAVVVSKLTLASAGVGLGAGLGAEATIAGTMGFASAVSATAAGADAKRCCRPQYATPNPAMTITPKNHHFSGLEFPS